MWYDTIDWWSAIRYHGATAQRTNKNLQELVISCAARQKRRFVRLFLLCLGFAGEGVSIRYAVITKNNVRPINPFKKCVIMG